MEKRLLKSLHIHSAVLFLAYLVSCGSPQVRPVWEGKIFDADHESQSVIRAQTGEQVFCFQPKFGEGVWISYRDLGCLFDQYINNVKEFSDPNKKCTRPPEDEGSDVKHIISTYSPDAHREAMRDLPGYEE